MIHVERVMTVPVPLAEVVAYLCDFAHAVDWDPGTVECTRAEGEEGRPVESGARWHNVSEFRGRRTELTYRLDRFEPDRLVFQGHNKTASTTDDLSFSPAEDGGTTRVAYHATIGFKGVAALASPFLRKEFEKLGDEITRTLPDAVVRHARG